MQTQKEKIQKILNELGIKPLCIRLNKATIDWKDYLKTLELDTANTLRDNNIEITVRR